MTPATLADTWWLAELDRYGVPSLVDGSHSDRAGAEKALTLFRQLGLHRDRRFAVAHVVLSEPTGEHGPINHDAVRTVNRTRMGRREQ